MSSSGKGSKRISVFDRLGPGNDDQPTAPHRRYSSSEKHLSGGAADKSRHTYGPPPPPHMREESMPIRKSSGSQSRTRHRPSDYPPPPPPPPPPTGDLEEEGGRRASSSGGSGPSRKPQRERESETHKMDRVSSGGSSGGPKSHHGPPRPPSSTGKHRARSAENSGGSGSDGELRAEEGRGHSHKGDQEPLKKPRRGSEGDEALNSSGTGRRLSAKHLDRKEKNYGPPERPLSGSTTGPIEAPTTSTSSTSTTAGTAGGVGGEGGSIGGKVRGRKEGGLQHDHKRRKEEEGGSSLESRSAGRKRKRDQVDDDPPAIEAKKLRTNDPYHHHHHPHPSAKETDRMARSKEGGGSGGGGVGTGSGAVGTGGGGGGVEVAAEGRSSVDRKRRHDMSAKDAQLPPRKHPRSRSPDTPRPSMPSGNSGTGNRRHERHGSSSRTSVTSPNSKKVAEHHHRSKGAPSSKKAESATGHESNEENESVATPTVPATTDATTTTTPEIVRKKLDWASVSNYTRKASTKLERRSTAALEKFSAGAIFARIGVSPSLAGEDYFAAISSLVSNHMKKTYRQKSTEEVGGGSSSTDALPSSLLESPFEGQQFASSCVSRIKEQLNWEHLIVDNVGPCRRALTASADYAIRKKLKKASQEFLAPSHSPTNWDSEHYATAVNLYQSLGKKASGKPAFRVQESQVGTLLISR